MRTTSTILTLTLITLVSLQADALTSRNVGPGIIHHHAFLSAGPWHIQILEIDLTDTMNTLETIKAGNAMAGYERTSAMAARSNSEGHTVVGAINADFYASGGITIGAQIIKGTLLKKPYPRSVFALSTDKKPYIGIVSLNGQVSKHDSLLLSINGVNEVRDTDELILYNHYMGSRTGTNQWGAEVELQYLEHPEGINSPFTAIVSAMDTLMEAGHGNMNIPASMGAVLSGHGTGRAFIVNNLSVGDTLVIGLNLPPSTDTLHELVGGTPRIIRNGVASVEWEQESVGSSFAHDRHPRTAVGFSADSSRVFFVTVDGRQGGYSVGMSLFELADYMLDWGIHQAVNLDGGGSTTMVVRDHVVNSPSDAGGERSVANALMAISKAPLGPLAYLNLPWEETFTLVESQLQFSVTGTDAYYNPVAAPSETLTWSCDASIGTITSSGLFSAGTSEADGYIYVSSGDIHDTTYIHITDISTLTLQPSPVILEIGENQAISAQAHDAFGNTLQVEPHAYTWWVSPDLATISDIGVISAENAGNGTIEASFHEVTASIPLTIGNSASVIVDDFHNTDNYTISGAVINLASCSLVADETQFVSGPTSGQLNYSLTTGGTSVLYLNCNIPISGTPESLSLQVFGDNSGHWIRGEFLNASNEKFVIDFTAASPGIDWDNEWREITILLENAAAHWGNPNAQLSFPITWTKIYLAETDDNNKDSGTIYLDDFKSNFISSGVDKIRSIQPKHFQFEDHFPNPFNASTRFRFSIYEPGLLQLKLYSVDGRQVDSLQLEVRPGSSTLNWEPKNLPSGIYVYQASMINQQISGKCLLVK